MKVRRIVGQREAEKKLDAWAELLLDTGKRNDLINFKDTKKGTVEVAYPRSDEFFEKIKNCRTSSFEIFDPNLPEDEDEDEDEYEDEYEDEESEDFSEVEPDQAKVSEGSSGVARNQVGASEEPSESSEKTEPSVTAEKSLIQSRGGGQGLRALTLCQRKTHLSSNIPKSLSRNRF